MKNVRLHVQKLRGADIMEKVRWQPDDSFDEIGHSDLAEKMRQQLKKDKKVI